MLNHQDALFEVNREINDAITDNYLIKAFDIIDRAKLLKKLRTIGVRGSALSWFSS